MGPGVAGDCLGTAATCSTLPRTTSYWEVVDPATGEPVPEGE